MNTTTELKEMVVYDFSNIIHHENGNDNCYSCDCNCDCDSNDCDCNTYCDNCD